MTSGGILKSMWEGNLFLQIGVGGEYNARCNLHLATLVPEVVLGFSPHEKEHLPASFAIRSHRFAHLQHLTNISVIMYETVSP